MGNVAASSFNQVFRPFHQHARNGPQFFAGFYLKRFGVASKGTPFQYSVEELIVMVKLMAFPPLHWFEMVFWHVFTLSHLIYRYFLIRSLPAVSLVDSWRDSAAAGHCQAPPLDSEDDWSPWSTRNSEILGSGFSASHTSV